MADTKRERHASEYEVEWREPPATGRSSRTALFQTLEAIKTRPGEWARVVKAHSRSGASSILSGINSEKRRVPEGKFEYEVRTDSSTNTSELFARFISED